MQAPLAPTRIHRYRIHDIDLQDPYHWLRDPGYPEVSDPEVLNYLEAENAYFEAQMAPWRELVDGLFDEMRQRQPEALEGVPYRRGSYQYRWRYPKDAQYQVWERAAVDHPDQWRVILDENQEAAGRDYFRIGALSLSPDARYLAWSADVNGSERYQLFIRDLQTGLDLTECISDTFGTPQWAADSTTLFYVVLNEQWRPFQVRRHCLDTPPVQDVLVYEETDEGFRVHLDRSQSQAYLFLISGDHVTSEYRLIPATDPQTSPVLVSPRRQGHEYSMDHGQGAFYILSNDEHANFRLARTPESHPAPEHWQTLIAGSDEHYLTGHLVLRDYLIVTERIQGLDAVRILDAEGTSHHVPMAEASYVLDLGINAEYDTDMLRLHTESLVTPKTEFDYHIPSRGRTVLKVQEIPSGYDAARYTSERLMITARDGTLVPVSLVYRRDLATDLPAPLYLYGYGAYGHAIPPGFSTTRLSLLERGMVFAIAHIRGGDDLGYHWYEAGKLAQRTNTFNDFVDAARALITQGYTAAGRIAIAGGSAGGELMGAAVNQAPELWGAVASHVPFVDVLNTMLDPSLPLTPAEWPEWGNPLEDVDAFHNIRSYSPYDQLQPGRYPPMLVTAGLHDPRVTYWEPAKYVAKLRTLKTDDNWLLLKTEMGAGHGGKSGRFESLREVAEEYAFILVSLGLAPTADADNAGR